MLLVWLQCNPLVSSEALYHLLLKYPLPIGLKSWQQFTNGQHVFDLLFYEPPIVCLGSVLVFVLVYVALCPF